ncbi:MAG: lipopolysaccharide biosynthesis protein [Suipraeoptans sp.]
MWIKKKLNNLSALSPAAKASLVLMMTQMIQKGLSIITSPIYTRLMTTSEYGEVTLFFSWYEILIIFTGFCLSKGVFNNGMIEYKKNRDVFAWSMCTLSILISISVCSIILYFSKFVYNFMSLPFTLILYMSILLTFFEALSIWTVKQRFEYRYKASAIITLVIAVVSPICGILGVILFEERKVLARIVGARNVFLVFYIALFLYLAYKAKGKIKVEYWKFAFRFNLPLIPHYLSLHILNHMDRIMISNIVGNSYAGIYSIAYNAASIVKIFWQSINASLMPWTYEKCSQNKFDELAKLTKVLIHGYGLLCIAFMLIAPEIMRILAPESYHNGIYAIPAIIAGVFFSALYYIFANVIYYYKKPKYVMLGSVCSAIVNVVLNILLIPRFGYLAAGYTTMISYILQVIIDYLAMKHILKKDIYDLRFILRISGLIILTSFILSYSYESIAIRVALLIIFAIYVILHISKNINIYRDFFKKKK